MNWIAVIVGAVVAFLVGWYWYSPKGFGEKWAEGSGVKLGDAKNMPVEAMLSQGAALLALSIVVGLTASANALGTAIFAILAAGLFVFSNGSFSGKSQYARLVDIAYVLVAGVIMIIVQGIL